MDAQLHGADHGGGAAAAGEMRMHRVVDLHPALAAHRRDFAAMLAALGSAPSDVLDAFLALASASVSDDAVRVDEKRTKFVLPYSVYKAWDDLARARRTSLKRVAVAVLLAADRHPGSASSGRSRFGADAERDLAAAHREALARWAGSSRGGPRAGAAARRRRPRG
jgi:hypothetical protein